MLRKLALAAMLVLFGASIGLSAQVTFSSQTYPLTQTPFQVVTGDFNGDGRPDVAVMSVTGGTVSILLANADGTFSAARDFPAITPQFSCLLCSFFPGIAVGDVNGDGKLDLVLADSYNPAGPSINVLLGNGDGTFGPAIITVMNFLVFPGQADRFIGVADFNGDKKQDVALFGYDGNTLGPFAMLGNGDGTFTPSVITPAAEFGPGASVVADVNGDGKPDIVIASIASGFVGILAVFLGNGDGTFKSGQQVQEQTSWSFTLAAGDFNHDGKIDLASASYQNYNCEFGVCTPILPTGALAMLSGNGEGSFGGPGELATGSYGLAATGDFDGDGNLDIAALGWPSVSPAPSVIMLGDGKGNFPNQSAVAFSNKAASMVSADFNGDGLSDIALVVGSDLEIELNTTPGFSLTASGSGSGISPGASATYTIDVGQQNGFGSAVTLACSSMAAAAAGIGCSFSPSSVTPGNSSTLTVTTRAASSGLVWPSAGSHSKMLHALWLPAVWLPVGAFLFGGIGLAESRCGKKRLGALILGCVAGASLIFQIACGGGSGSSQSVGTPSGNYTISVTGVSGSLQRSTSVTLTVN